MCGSTPNKIKHYRDRDPSLAGKSYKLEHNLRKTSIEQVLRIDFGSVSSKSA